MKKYIFFSLILAIGAVLVFQAQDTKATVIGCENTWCKPTPTPRIYHYGCTENHQCKMIWGYGQNSCEDSYDCNTPTPTPSCVDKYEWQECVTPTPTPSVEPSPTPTPTPVVVLPSVTPETPQPTDQHLNNTTDAYICPNGETKLLPINAFVLRNGDTAIVRWVPTIGDQVNIYYRLNVEKNWSNALADQPNNGVAEIHGLGSRDWTFGLQQKQDCGGGIIVIVDSSSTTWRIWWPSYVL